MDPITTAIIGVLPALASDLVKSSVKDAYEGLKSVVRRKLGDGGPASAALTELENNPDSKSKAAALSDRLVEAKATDDRDIMVAVTKLIEELRAQGATSKPITNNTITITGGSQGVVGAQNVSIGSMTIGGPPNRDAT